MECSGGEAIKPGGIHGAHKCPFQRFPAALGARQLSQQSQKHIPVHDQHWSEMTETTLGMKASLPLLSLLEGSATCSEADPKWISASGTFFFGVLEKKLSRPLGLHVTDVKTKTVWKFSLEDSGSRSHRVNEEQPWDENRQD